MLDERKYNMKESQNNYQDAQASSKEELDIYFEAYEGGYGGPNFFYSIERVDDSFQFKTYCEDFTSEDPYFEIVEKTEKEYQDFMNVLKKDIEEWCLEYNNPNILDGTQWTISLIKERKVYNGSNSFPKNYIDVMKLIKKYFPPLPLKYEIDLEKEKPYEDFDDSDLDIGEEIYDIPNNIVMLAGELKNSKLYYQFSFCLTANHQFELTLAEKENSPIIRKVADISQYEKLLKDYHSIVSNWKDSYTGNKDISWIIEEYSNSIKVREGKGEVPENWSSFINLLIEYEKLYQSLK